VAEAGEEGPLLFLSDDLSDGVSVFAHGDAHEHLRLEHDAPDRLARHALFSDS
jgi:hypothetical protein